ncbi:hypothetical protein ASC77_00655 [Nocardioides sp. Root1257]|uniref:hypothetical protein n=1 Tax=unclassified Nocardioides TaxID=2615069 RepID=UPI0006FCB839|nr:MULTISPECIES: hypothetical protein [unclassified Nocardioides]KQW52865.1 hypothetical protein ASC77_00655 [Nocardioides sp. Root1257]KRC55553.1 hypothetical protein ASE24_00655 [Nocardioides sp. Root224]
MSRTLVRACAASALVVLLAPLSPASAEKWAARDARGDVEGYTYVGAASEDECPTVTDFDAPDDANDDIVRLSARHTRTSIIVSTVFRDLDPASEQMLSVHLKTADRGWFVDVNRSEVRPGRFRTFVFMSREPKLPDLDQEDLDPPACGTFGFITTDVGCKGRHFSVDFDRNVIQVELPRSCLHDPRWVRVGAGANGFENLEPPADQPDLITFNGYSDSWGPEAGTGTGWLPPFGPRIHLRPGVVS